MITTELTAVAASDSSLAAVGTSFGLLLSEESIVNHDSRRITLISRHTQLQERKWQHSASAASRIILLDSFTILRTAISGSFNRNEEDVERIILDRSSSASDYLALLAELPDVFHGDVLMIRGDETGFLSSTGRGGDRILYALSSEDIRFYLETTFLIEAGGEVMAPARHNPVLQFRQRSAVA
jgi:hypothetical protein